MIQRSEPALILATASTARRAVLAAAGLQFTAQAAAVDEAAIKESAQAEGLPATEAAMLLAGGVARPAPGLAVPWVLLPAEGPASELRHRVLASYEAARRALPASVQVTLDRTSG